MKFSKFAQFTFALTLGTLSLSLPHTSHGHCQVPCGIYNDGARVEAMLEDAATVLKATRMLAERTVAASSSIASTRAQSL